MSKTLVLFVFHVFNERCENFINNCIFKDPNVDFIIISNDKNARFNAPPYVKKLFRDNIGYDFGGWSDALLKDDLYKGYSNFIFINSSVIGPFLRPDFKGKWTDIYLNGLQGNVKLFGTAINAMGDPLKKAHVQSYVFALDRETLEYLISEGIFSNTKYVKSFKEAIDQKEILMSRKVIERGWNIGSLFPLYEGVDFTFRTKKPENYNIKFQDDIMMGHYFGSLWTDQQLVFVKGNRDLKFAKPVNEGYSSKSNWLFNYNFVYNFLYIVFLVICIVVFLRYPKCYGMLVLIFIILLSAILHNISIVKRKPIYNLSLLTICKNESMVIDEFIQHYLWQGVDHIYIIDNDSTDNTRELVKKYPQVSYYYLPDRNKQVEHYNNIYNKIKDQTEWLIIADVDEYIYNRSKGSTIKDYLRKLDYEKTAAVHINWKMFGSSGFKEQPASIRKSFTSAQSGFHENVKAIVNTSLTKSLIMHTHNYSNDNIVQNPDEDLALNHYAIMSEHYFRTVKMTRGDADGAVNNNIRDMNYFAKYDFKDVQDYELSTLVEN